MRLITTILLFVIIISLGCNKKNNSNFELEILNDSLASYCYYNPNKKDTIIKIIYKLTNKTNNKYYFNLSVPKKDTITGVSFDFYTKSINVFDGRNKIEKKNDLVYDNFDECFMKYNLKESKELDDYSKLIDSSKNIYFYYKEKFKYNFFINPNETIYFESLVKICARSPFFNKNTTISYVIKKNKKYWAKLYIYVDGNFKDNSMPWHILERIKTNNYKKFTGIIESKNKVPVKVLE
jgi:hypothetical protein